MTIIKSAVFLSVTLILAGCAADLRQASSEKIEKMTRVKTVDNLSRLWSAPELQVRHYRTQFYGYDTVQYRLAALKPDSKTETTSYRLEIEANYGATYPRHYDSAKSANEVSYPLKNSSHEAMRCQLFGDMANACLYRDRANVEFSLAELEAGSQSGMKLILGSADKAYESIDLPAQYVAGFLQAVNNPGLPGK